MNLRIAMLAATVVASPISAQTAADHIRFGDRDNAAMNAVSALRHYQEAVRMEPHNADALCKASLEAIDLGEFNDGGRDSLYSVGEQLARRAVQADPRSSMAHFALSRALGRRALTLGVRDRVKYAAEVRAAALEALRLDSLNAGALHVMGLWHAEIMRLSGVSRFIAKNILGGGVFDEANWNDAVGFLERSVARQPAHVVHRLDLADVYADRRATARAREQYQMALQLKPLAYNDTSYQRQAERGLKALR